MAATSLATEPAAHSLTVGEQFTNPLGYHDRTPVFSWKLPAGSMTAQTSYRIIAARGENPVADDKPLWDSGQVDTDQSTRIPYGGADLASRQRVYWQVKVWDEQGRESDWSKPAWFELGLLDNSDWRGQWIRLEVEIPQPELKIVKAVYGVADNPEQQIDLTAKLNQLVGEGTTRFKADNDLAGTDPAKGIKKTLQLEYTIDGEPTKKQLNEGQAISLVGPDLYTPQYLRRTFTGKDDITRARLYVTARGLYEIWLNGEKVGTDHFVPGWTSYDHHLETLTYDVTAAVRAGDNVLGAVLGEGWYAGRMMTKKTEYPEVRPALLLQLEITRADGSTETIATDDQWIATDNGPMRSSGIYDGEVYDANHEMPGWNQTGFDAAGWQAVVAEDVAATPLLVPKQHTAVRATGELPARSVTEPTPGRFVFDLGQNMVGILRLAMPVTKGETITVRFAEMLNPDGTIYTANYRGAKSTDSYTAARTGTISWAPTFTFHGFRYVELSGLPADARPEPTWVTGIVLHSDMRRIGTFTSSHAKLNQLQSNIVWGQRGNFLDIPTDCPQRDERLGWTGDAQVFAPTALFNYDSHAFFKSWLRSMRDDQLPNGSIPHVIPATMGGGSPGWQDAGTVVPWEVYLRTGDREVLADNLEMMKRLVGFYRARAKNHLIEKIGAFGDWLQPYAKQTQGDTPYELIGTAYYALDAELVARAARVLGRTDDADQYAAEATAVKQAFAAHYFTEAGKLQNAPETQTAYLLAIGFDLIPDDLRKPAAEHLAALVHAADDHLRTGFLGTPLINPVLDEMGYSDLAVTVLFKESYPSWFFSIDQGATTMWERWNSYSHAEGFGSPGMNSFNHYAYGAIGTWMVERLPGLAPDPAQPGYKHFFVRPLTAGPLTSATAELETPYGRAASSWKKENGKVTLEVVVPPNTTATVIRPGDQPAVKVSAGTHSWSW